MIVCGHTHILRVVPLPNGTVIVKPGRVGLPAYDDEMPNYHSMETYTPNASYAIIEKREHQWHVELLSVSYCHQRSAERARCLGR
jgi:predicted phosphodiesterase